MYGSVQGDEIKKPDDDLTVNLAWTPTWTPKVCKIMAPRAILRGLGLLF